MHQEINRQRIRSIYKMLFEIAAGNFSYRIPRSTENDELEALIVLVNMIAEEMKTSAFHSAYINPYQTYQHVVHTTIILDENFKIKSFTPDTPAALGFPPDMLYGMDFGSVLAEDSQKDWLDAKIQLRDDPDYRTNIVLMYTTNEQLLVPATCTISRLLHHKEILISSVTTVVQDNSPTKDPNPNPLRNDDAHRSDAFLIQQLYDYILDHLETPLPPLRELARKFGTNEFKLKSGFKHFFKTSIYQFYNDERLKRAKVMIEETTMPLKHIAFMSGFSTYPNFSKAFRKKYNFAPNEVKRSGNLVPRQPEEDDEE